MSERLSGELEEFGRLVQEGADEVSVANRARLERANASFNSICSNLMKVAEIGHAQLRSLVGKEIEKAMVDEGIRVWSGR